MEKNRTLHELIGYSEARLSDWTVARFILKHLFPFTIWFSLYGSRLNMLGTFPGWRIYFKKALPVKKIQVLKWWIYCWDVQLEVLATFRCWTCSNHFYWNGRDTSNAMTQFQLCYHLQSNENALEAKDMHPCKCLHSTYGYMRLNIKMKVKKIRQLPRDCQILEMHVDEWLHFSVFIHPSIHPKLMVSWWVPWLGNNRRNRLPKIMAHSTVHTNIDTYGFVNTPAQVPFRQFL